MLFKPNCDLTDPQCCFYSVSSIVKFWWVWANCRLSFLFLSNIIGTWFAAVARLLQDLTCLAVRDTTYHGCNKWLFDLVLVSCQLEANWPKQFILSPLTSGINETFWMFFLIFRMVLCNVEKAVWKIPSRSAVLEILRTAHLAPGI